MTTIHRRPWFDWRGMRDVLAWFGAAQVFRLSYQEGGRWGLAAAIVVVLLPFLMAGIRSWNEAKHLAEQSLSGYRESKRTWGDTE